MARPADQSDSEFRQVLRQAHDEADRLLAEADSNRLDVVVWLSGHIAAFEHAVYPAVKRRVAAGADMVGEDREIVAQLSRVLRMLERRQSGDVLASGLSGQRMIERLRELVGQHRVLQARIVAALEAALDPAEISSLVHSYEDALAHAPTRPHPHLRGGAMFWLDALRDRILDTMDGRHVPIPRVRRVPISPGRWGNYLLGQQHQDAQEPEDPRATA